MAGVAVKRDTRRMVSTPIPYCKLNALRHTRQRKSPSGRIRWASVTGVDLSIPLSVVQPPGLASVRGRRMAAT
jgi:hypothetical protein